MRTLVVVLLMSLALPALAKARETEKWVQLNGKRTKLATGFHENGKRWYVHYWRGGKKVGTHKDYDIEGRLRAEVRYRNDILQGRFTTWHASGEVATRGTYKDGAVDGAYEDFHPDGKPRQRRGYADGLPDGGYLSWHPNGQKHIEGAFKAGTPVGTWTQYAADGKVEARPQFVAGKRQLGPAPKVDLSGPFAAPDFRFQWVTGSALEGYNFNLRVEANGDARLVTLMNMPKVAKKTTDGLRRGELYYDQRALVSEFRLNGRDQRRLREKLAELDPFSKAALYVDQGVHDGSQWHLTVTAGGEKKQITLSNQFPEAFRRFRLWVEGDLMREYPLARLTARPTDWSAGREIGY